MNIRFQNDKPAGRVEDYHGISFLLSYYWKTLKGLARKQRLHFKCKNPGIASMSMTVKIRNLWRDLYGLAENERDYQFNYFLPTVAIGMLCYLEELGINFRNVLHLKSDMRFNPGSPMMEPGKTYSVGFRLDDIAYLDNDRVVFVGTQQVSDERGVIVSTHTDSLLIRNVPERYIHELRSNPRFDRIDVNELRGLPLHESKIAASGTEQGRVTIPIPRDLGKQFGFVAGYRNIVHASYVASWLFGYRKPFIQGLCLANLVIRHLVAAGGKDLQDLTTFFSRPLYLGEEVTLLYTGAEFEIVGGKGEVLAFGKYR